MFAPFTRAFLATLIVMGGATASLAQGQPITFTVTGDIPYEGKEDLFQSQVDDHNLMSPSELFFHVGDIKDQDPACVEFYYAQTFDIMTQLAVPSFIVPGDNEWNDCPDPDSAWLLWEAYFTDFEQNFCGTPPVESQAVRHENFALVHEGVLFIGLNLVGGSTYDQNEREIRLQDDADWVEQQFSSKRSQVRAAVIIAHAERSGSRDTFYDQFDASASAFGKPILFVHGNTHDWAYTTNWGAPNISRISIEQNDPPLEVTVTMNSSPFIFERNPWPSGTPDFNHAPCVEAGPDQTASSGDTVQLDGFVTDDGVPTSGNLSLSWSTVAGPSGAQASFGNPGSERTSATFPVSGQYQLRLTANDGGLSTSDDLLVEIESDGPSLRIGDATVTEGDSGTTSAVFTVELVDATGASVNVAYSTANGTAQAGSDYQARSGNLSFSGSTTSRSISVPVNGDLEVEEFETFQVRLSNASGAAIADGVGDGLIIDDDVPPSPTIFSLSPSSGPAGTLVSVSGEFFTGTTAVTIGGINAGFQFVSDSLIRFTLPGNAKSGPVRVTNGAGTGTSAGDFTVEYYLTVSADGPGSVSLQPGGGLYAEGTTVTLTPSASAGSEFLVWSGDLGGIEDPAAVTMTRNKSITATFVPAGTVVRVPVSASVAGSNDDAEERLSSGGIKLTSSDLELGQDGTREQAVGVRFVGVDIPQGSTILSAAVQFTADETSIGDASLVIRGEGRNNAAAFSAFDGNVSGRTTTAASATWNPPSWNSVGAAGAGQRTPDLASIVQEIVTRPGWVPGNALAFIVTGTGGRTAESYDGVASSAPRLEVVYQASPDEEPPSVPQNLRSPTQTENSISLVWDASTDDVGVTGYRVYGPGGTTNVTGTSHVETGLVATTSYDFQVSALDAAGNESSRSPVLSISTALPDTQPPSPPGNLRSPSQTGNSIDLLWNAATDDRGVTGYRVYGPGGTTDVTATSHTETNLSPSTVYGFQVSALDAAGNESDPSPVLQVSTGAAEPVALSLRISSSGDDAEERLSSGAVNLTSSDIELGFDRTREQAVGLRFTGVGIPKGATIVSASVLFTTDEVKTGASSLSIRGEAADSAAPFSGTGNVSGRQTTSNVVAWSPPDWTTVGAAGAAQRTPDLKALIQEIVGRQGWAQGNALAFVITGSGTRTAESYNGSSGSAPLLEVVYLDEPDLEDPTQPQNLHSPAQTSVSIELAWNASSDNVGVTGYRVYGPSGSTDVAGTSHVETGLSAGTTYAFQVSALDAAGNESSPSGVLNVSTTAPDNQNPSQPQNLRSPDQTGTTIDLAWNASTDNVGVTGYRVYGPGGTTDVSGTTHVATGLAPATSYSFQVSALDAAGNESNLSATLNVSTGASAPVSISVGIASGADDVEERPASGSIKTDSSDLEMTLDGTNVQVVGLRFTGVSVPAGANINSAYLQFTADESQAEATSLEIRAELSADAAPFGGASTYPTTRTTSAAVSWTPAAWSRGDSGVAQRTPELAGLVQQVVDRAGWSSGNALVLIVDGSGKRVAEAFEGGAATAARLVIEYEE